LVLNMHPKKKLAHLDTSGVGAVKMMNGVTSHSDMDDHHTSATPEPKFPPSGFYSNQPYLSLKSPGHSIPSLKPYHHIFSGASSTTPHVPAFVDVYHEATVSNKSVNDDSVPNDRADSSNLLMMASNHKKSSLQLSKSSRKSSNETAEDSNFKTHETSSSRRVSLDNPATDNTKEDDEKGKENVREGRPRRERAPSTAKKSRDVRTKCDVCLEEGNNSTLVRCDECARCFHFACLNPPCKKSPKVHGWSWSCSDCAPSDVDKSWHL